MDVILNIMMIILVVMICIVLVLIYIPYFINHLKKFIGNKQGLKQPFNCNQNTEKEKSEFLTNSTPGIFFVRLIYKGIFLCLKTGNHGNEFPDNKQMENFRKYLSSEISVAISNLEVEHEKFII